MKFKNSPLFFKRIMIPAIILVFIYFLGSLGYMIIEEMTFLDSLFMTTITLTTVGYGLIKELSEAGTIFTILLIIFGTGTAAYILITLTDFILSEFLSGRIEKRRKIKMISKLKNHYIICGLGRVGLEIAKELSGNRVDFIIVDNADGPIEIARQNNWLYIKGDATNDETLIETQIASAKCLFAALDTDSENVYVILSAKSLNPSIFVVARATIHETINKIEKAGADRVVSPQIIGGRRMAAMALQPSICDFLNTIMQIEEDEIKLAEIEITPNSRIDNVIISEAGKKYEIEALIISVIDKGEKISIKKASGDTKMKSGQKIIAIGTASQIKHLTDLATE
ncbi:MAG: potassium channel protein [Actinomycetota bacterium]|nr:potassium channel protein [Actinomycetota bacterium]